MPLAYRSSGWAASQSSSTCITKNQMSRLLAQFVKHYTSLSSVNSLRRVIDGSWSRVNRGNEVAAVRAYLMDPGVGVDYLNKNVASHVNTSNFHLKFAGVFCHKKPIVQRTPNSKLLNAGDTPGCELGDLLVLFVLFDFHNQLHYMAGSLFQAKLGEKLTSKSQQHLYDDDNDFILPGYMGGHMRLMPNLAEGRGRALRYLILNPNKPNTYVSCRHSPWTANYQPRWSTYLDGLLGATDGLATSVHPTATLSAWDQIVRDLLSVASKIPARKPPRGTDIAVQVATSLFNDFTDHQVWSADTNNPGVSVLLAIAHAHQGAG